MAKFGQTTDANLLVVSGVKFMGETSKILSPEKTVLMPTLEATCSLDLGCPIEDFKDFLRSISGQGNSSLCKYIRRSKSISRLGCYFKYCLRGG